jgi:hypothetical protein
MSCDVMLINLHCVTTNDAVTDEVKMQQDGRQFWPNDGDGYFSISTGNTVVLNNIIRQFTGESTTISLYDDEDFGSDDFLGSTTIPRDEGGNRMERQKHLMANGAHYVLTYRVKDNGEF